ncbi:formate/nitrite transporter [Saccharicrinis carchari]|uniref:Formate/nitrite transporter n=1 Tax=Saccharicrinis carchari TaxID=1168039 RepID=A0A521D3V5_SACCC|nr:formate/nitrite transporter family protein [Saccharicrinis carchari]SMO66373.1 formate/nitrite transporter [Saccharicrinis carchari]
MSLYNPPEIIKIAGEAAIAKHSYSTRKILTLSFLAGAYISFGGLLSILIGGGVPGLAAENPGIAKFLFGAAFPVGLMIVVMAGAELFTGNNAYFMPNVLSKKQTWRAPLRNWGLVYLGNFAGSIFVAYFLTHLTDVVAQQPWQEMVHNIAISKTSNPFYKTFLKGIGANWLVCLALWMGMSAQHTSGKILAIWWPVMAFVVMGFEHSIANMFFIPLAIYEGANLTWVSFVSHNLIPATLGNIVGGAFFVGTLYWYAYQKKA